MPEALALEITPRALKKSDLRQIFYIAGFVVRKVSKMPCCVDCTTLCVHKGQYTRISEPPGFLHEAASSMRTCVCDRHSSSSLASLKQTSPILQFSASSSLASACELFMRTVSLMSWLVRKERRTSTVGCEQHKAELTAAITGLHFYVKEQNKQREQK